MAISFALSTMDREGLGNHPFCWAHWPSSVLAARPSNLPQEMRPPPQLCIYVGPWFLLLQIRESILLWACKWEFGQEPRELGRGDDDRADETGCPQEQMTCL